MLGTLLREGLRAGPGEPGESPSPATSWISRARVATSFTSVWLSLQPAGGKAGPCGLLPVRPHGGAAGDRSRGGGGDSVPQAGAGGPTRRWPPGEGRGTETLALVSAERQGPAGHLGERRAETPPGPGHVPLSCGHRDHTGPAPRDTEVGLPIRVRVRLAQRGQGPPHRTAGQVTAPGTSRTPRSSAPRRERLGARWGPAPCPWLPARPRAGAAPLPWILRLALLKPPAKPLSTIAPVSPSGGALASGPHSPSTSRSPQRPGPPTEDRLCPGHPQQTSRCVHSQWPAQQ